MAENKPPEGVRVADEAIYANEDRRNDVKDAFKVACEMIKDFTSKQDVTDGRLLDVGCATGDFLDYTSKTLTGYMFAGLEVSELLAQEASNRLPNASIKVGTVLNKLCFVPKSFNVIFVSGVLNCLDDPEPALNAMIDWLKPGGLLLIFDMINANPIDVITRHRKVSDGLGNWETGWNYFSMKTYKLMLNKRSEVTSVDFKEFQMTKFLPKREDPMRTWTQSHPKKPRQLVNGANQLINQYFISIQKR